MFVGIQSLLKFCMCDRCMLLVNTSNGKCCFLLCNFILDDEVEVEINYTV